jgi:hypothetical protein
MLLVLLHQQTIILGHFRLLLSTTADVQFCCCSFSTAAAVQTAAAGCKHRQQLQTFNPCRKTAQPC